MSDLKTNYKDDVLDTSKNEKRKFRMIQNDDGTVSFDDATEYTQQGDNFGAADINATNAKINEQSQSLTYYSPKLNQAATNTYGVSKPDSNCRIARITIGASGGHGGLIDGVGIYIANFNENTITPVVASKFVGGYLLVNDVATFSMTQEMWYTSITEVLY